MNGGEIRMVLLAGKVNSVYQLPEQIVTEKTEEKFGVDFFSYLENFSIKKEDIIQFK
jgi:hypothetical protein